MVDRALRWFAVLSMMMTSLSLLLATDSTRPSVIEESNRWRTAGQGNSYPGFLRTLRIQATDTGVSSIIQPLAPITPGQAAQLAQERVVYEAQAGRMPDWSDATLSEPMPYFDLGQEIDAYFFSVTRQDQDVGYIVVAAFAYVNPILEWSSSPAPHLKGINTCRQVASNLGLEVFYDRFFYLGALSHYCLAAPEPLLQQLRSKQLPTGQVALIDMNDSRITILEPEDLRTYERNHLISDGEDAARQISKLMSDTGRGFKQLTVPVYYQHCYGTCFVGCGPTAAGTLMGYWSSHGYPNLLAGGSQVTIERLHDLAGTSCCGGWSICSDPNGLGFGCTWWDDIDEAMESYAAEKGYTAQSSYISSPTFDEYKSEISGNRPVVLGLMGSLWGDHIVSGIGYSDDNGQYMIVNPNLNGSGVTWIQYGQGYTSIGMDTLDLESECPQSGAVILFKDAGYSCAGQGEGSGWVRRSSTGWQNVPASFNDQASSVKVPDGWSVRLFEHSDRGGGWACRSSSDDTFWGEHFSNGVSLNDNVSSFEVFNSANCCLNPPNAPTLVSPANWYVSENGQAPTLYWSNNGDPDGDTLTFHVEVRGPTNADSPWTAATFWRPDNLDGQEGEYQWRVEAKDSCGATRWSSQTWHFTLNEDEPPHISFDYANGTWVSGNGQVFESNNSNWSFAGTASDDHGVDHIDYHSVGSNGIVTERAAGTTAWSFGKAGLAGHNSIYFRAYDSSSQPNPDSDKHYIEQYVDMAAPATEHNLVGEMGQNNWYVSSVNVTLMATDHGSGNNPYHWIAGVQTLYYQVDGGTWQQHAGSTKNLTVSGDGLHSVRYYARDRVGNQEAQHEITFKIDVAKPAMPGAATEAHGAISDQWQKTIGDPAFAWVPSSDATSGVWYYKVSWNGTLQVTTGPAYDPPPVGTGTYLLSVEAVDQAGNVSPPGAAFTFRYDITPPHAPDVNNDDGVASGVWQNRVRTAHFSWPTPYDAGSGIAGYYVYWGPEANGQSDILVPGNTFTDLTPICGPDQAAVYYLNTQSQDNVDLLSGWVTYSLAYDGAAPTAILTANYGLSTTHQTMVHLAIAANDEGSGADRMRLSNDARSWTEWLDLAPETYWQIPDVGRRFHPIYLQVADRANNVSPVVSDTIYLDVNVPRPRSENYWLWDDMMPAGATHSDSASYTLRSSIGQPLDSPILTSLEFTIYSGYQAGALAEPTLTPTYTTYIQIGYVMAGGGTGATTLQSADYEMYGSLGQPAVVGVITSTNYVLLTGFWGGAGHGLPPPEPPEPPEPPLPPECEFYSVSINDAALFTASPEVTLTLCGPDAAEIMLSNDGGFGSAVWQPYTTTVPWVLDVYGQHVLPRLVYARFRDSSGAIYGTFPDDIVFDPTAPGGLATFDLASLLPRSGTLGLGSRPLPMVAQRSADLYISALDDNSGLAEMQISNTPAFTTTEWLPYSAIVPVTFTVEGTNTLYVRFRDSAGNVSGTASASAIVDTEAPSGAASVLEGIVGPNTISVTVALWASEQGEGMEARIGSTASLTDTLWQPYTPLVAVPVAYNGDNRPVLYFQLRDKAGNESQVYTTTYLVDTMPPVLYAEVLPGDTLTRTVTVLAYDDLTSLGQMWLSNDPDMMETVATLPYTPTVSWTFDARHAVWVRLADSVGNWSDPYSAYATGIEPGGSVYLPLVFKRR